MRTSIRWGLGGRDRFDEAGLRCLLRMFRNVSDSTSYLDGSMVSSAECPAQRGEWPVRRVPTFMTNALEVLFILLSQEVSPTLKSLPSNVKLSVVFINCRRCETENVSCLKN